MQGDVIAILDGSGYAVVEYMYDAWGKLLSTTTNSTSNCTSEEAAALGVHNPLRYRGYVYDQETGLYYLQSRYYDPELGRFLNADALIATGDGLLGNNMFAYCLNNPITYYDHSGKDPVLFAAAGAGVAGGALSLYYYLNSNEDATFGGALLAAIGGATAGALAGAASMLTGNPQILCAISSAIVAGLVSDCSGGSIFISAPDAFLAAYAGLYIDISMYNGIELALASFVASLGTGFPAERISQELHNDLHDYQSRSTPDGTAPADSGSKNGFGAGGFNPNQVRTVSCIY